MNPSDYQAAALRTEAPAGKILDRLGILPREESERLVRLDHAIIGIQTESGELATTIKKALFYAKPLDMVNIGEEIGDIIWYVALACAASGLNLGDIMQANIAKLKARYPDKFSEERADEDNRDLKKELAALQGN